MKKPKKYPKKQLEKFSAIFMQLGLVLVLFIVLVALEYKSSVKVEPIASNEGELIEKPYDFEKAFILVKEIKKVQQPKKRKLIKDFSNIKKTDEEDAVETVIPTPENNTTNILNVNLVDEAREDDIDETDDPVLMVNIQNIPVFKGCEGLSEEETRVCFEKKMQRHVKRYFNTEIAQDAGLRSGKYRIFTQFVIDKTGNITDVRIKAPHKRLEKEANKVIDKIPQFTPGKQNNKPVKVKYTLPIAFKVE